MVLLGMVSIISCSDDDDNVSQKETLNGNWNLINISGGFAGINDTLPEGLVTWSFDGQDSTLTIDNNCAQADLFCGHASGAYKYSTIEINNKFFLSINNNEVGQYKIFNNNTLIIDQNNTQSSSGTDGFLFRFER